MDLPEPPIHGVHVRALRKHADERGWFCELRRESWYRELSGGRPAVQTNLSSSKAGVIRGLHWHRRNQDDLFFCPVGRARVVLFDRRDDSPTAGVAWLPLPPGYRYPDRKPRCLLTVPGQPRWRAIAQLAARPIDHVTAAKQR